MTEKGHEVRLCERMDEFSRGVMGLKWFEIVERVKSITRDRGYKSEGGSGGKGELLRGGKGRRGKKGGREVEGG